MKKNRISIVLRVIVLAMLVTVFAAAFPAPSHADFTYEDEKRLGKEFYEKIKEADMLVKDEQLNEYIDKIGRRLLTRDNRYPLDFTFSVIRSSGINAFATPGGYIYLFTGLINLVENESQLAGVLAHEIAHIQARHIAQMIAKSKQHSIATLAALIAGAFLGGGEGAAVMGSLASATSASMSLKYSREHEEEADRLGMSYLTGAGYNGRGMLEFLKIMQFNQYYSTAIPSYFLTHPKTSDRITYLTMLLETRYSDKGAKEIVGGLPRYQTRLHLMFGTPRDNMRIFSDRIDRNPDDVEALYGLAVSESEMGRIESSRRHFRRALELSPLDWEITRDFGISLFEQGNVEYALAMLKRAYGMKKEDRDILFYLGRCYETMNQPETAISYFRHVNTTDPDDEDTLYHLAVNYGNTGELGLSHYYFGFYFKKTGKTKSALFHFRTALEHLSTDSPQAGDIRKAMETMEA
ncbi:MAG TPA: tetratricopeptide repeat protein [Deltaproteobacteria bacterium]|nr:tetratricopeptide repeat protein [Deltaproteobacteria bacterium]